MRGVRHTITIQPVYQRERHSALGCELRRTVAYRPICSCGFVGKARGTVKEARIVGVEHVETNAASVE